MIDFPSSKVFIIFCHKHPNFPLVFGCNEYECEFDQVMCSKCVLENPYHEQQHKRKFVAFNTYVEILSTDFAKSIRNNVLIANQNIRKVFDNESTYIYKMQEHAKLEKSLIETNVSSIITSFIQQTNRIQKELSDFLENQVDNFKRNLTHFKKLYSHYSSETNYEKYANPNFIKSKLLMKSPLQAFYFLQNVRKNSALEFSNFTEINNLANKILFNYNNPPNISSSIYEQIRNIASRLYNEIKENLFENCNQIANLSEDYIRTSNETTVSFNRKRVRLDRSGLLNNQNFTISLDKVFQTEHANSVSAIIPISNDILATASYDRTIKIWRISDNSLIKSLYDQNSICCLELFYFSDELAIPTLQGMSVKHQQNLQHKINQNPDTEIIDLGFLLISGGLDKLVKAWNFNMLPNTKENIEAYLEYAGHSNWITCLMSLEDCENIVSGDDNGEIIIWDVLKCKEKFKFTVYHKNIISCLTLIERYKRFASASADSIRIWEVKYKEMGIKKTLVLCNCERSFTNEAMIYSLISSTNYINLLIIGGKGGKIRYLDIKKGNIVFENNEGNNNEYVGDFLLIEKNAKIFDEEYEETSKNFNLISLGNNVLNIQDGYGTMIQAIKPQNNEDFYCNQVLPNRNSYILAINQTSKDIILKVAVVSQYSSQFYNYKSSRISILNIVIDNLKKSL